MSRWQYKIERSKQLLGELKSTCKSFSSSQPYKIGTKKDPKTKRLIYYIQEIKEIPPTIALITGDIIQNLRSALDHLAYSLFIKETGGKLSGNHIYFPIEKDFDTYIKEKGRKTKGISEEIIKLMDVVKPFKGGNDNLWRIHELNRIDKHRLLLTIIPMSSFSGMDVGAHMYVLMKESFPMLDMPQFSLFIKPADEAAKVGAELFIDRPNAKEIPNMQFKFNLTISLNEPGIVEGESLIKVVQSLIEEVEILVPIFSRFV